VLTIIGLILIFGGTGIVFHLFDEYIANDRYNRGYPFIAVGALCFLPGIWVLFIALMAALRVPGYSYQQIPQFEAEDLSTQ